MSTSHAVFSSTGQYALAHYDCIFVVAWKTATPLEGVKQMVREGRVLSARYPRGFAVLTVVQDAPMPDKEARDQIASFMQQHSAEVRAAAVVVEGAGFRQAAIRGVVTGLNLLARQSFPQHVFGHVEDAAKFLFTNLSETLSPGASVRGLLDVTGPMLRMGEE